MRPKVQGILNLASFGSAVAFPQSKVFHYILSSTPVVGKGFAKTILQDGSTPSPPRITGDP